MKRKINITTKDNSLAADFIELEDDGTLSMNTYDSFAKLDPKEARELAKMLNEWADSWTPASRAF